jgi:transcription initiation factor IIE alpha subunit
MKRRAEDIPAIYAEVLKHGRIKSKDIAVTLNMPINRLSVIMFAMQDHGYIARDKDRWWTVSAPLDDNATKISMHASKAKVIQNNIDWTKTHGNSPFGWLFYSHGVAI